MERIPPNPTPDAKSKVLLVGVKKMLGFTPNLFTTLAHSSSSLGFAVAGFTGFGESKLSPALREQVALTVAGANACAYCASAHTALGKMHKVAESELSRNLGALSGDRKTQAALTFARKLVDLRGRVSDADLEEVRKAGYSDGEILDLVTVTVFNIFTNYVNHVAGTEIDFPRIETARSAA
ncbi:MAG TPA: carboxymuconolactone decarboxylase family protein [bacterium]|nr:carboxymuconolactone decarboxylase family protein [bacterium]